MFVVLAYEEMRSNGFGLNIMTSNAILFLDQGYLTYSELMVAVIILSEIHFCVPLVDDH